MSELDGIKARTRGEWLTAVLAGLRQTFAEGGIRLPAITATTGFAQGSARGSSKVVEITSTERAGEISFDLYVSPRIDDSMTVLAGVADAVCRIVTGKLRGSSRAYRDLAKIFGLDVAFKRQNQNLRFRELVGNDILAKLGDYPHSAIAPMKLIQRHSGTGLKTRLIPATCLCGFRIYLTRQKIAIGVPLCGNPICEEQGVRLRVCLEARRLD